MIKLINLLNEIKINDPRLTPRQVEEFIDYIYSKSDDYIESRLKNILRNYSYKKDYDYDVDFIQFLAKLPDGYLTRLYKELKELEKEL